MPSISDTGANPSDPQKRIRKPRTLSLREMSDVHRRLPTSIEAEQGTLGSMMLEPLEVCGMVVEMGMKADWFSSPPNGLLFDLLLEVYEQKRLVVLHDSLILTEILRERKQLEGVGGVAYISSLIDFTPTAANARYYAEIVFEKWVLRQVIVRGSEMVSRAYDDSGEVGTLLDESETALLGIRDSFAKPQQDKTIKEHVLNAIENLELLFQNTGALVGLSTGLKGIDNLTSGLKPANMIVIAARPSMGKTALGMNIAEHVAVKLKIPVAVFSLEMSTMDLVQRMLCSRARVSAERIRSGKITEKDFPNLTTAAGAISESPLFIDDTAGLSIGDLRAKARRLHKEHKLGLIVVDYLQLMRSTTKRAQDNRQLEVAEISSGLKALAKELNIPLIVMAQLNRKPEDRASGKPRLSDLRESGAIEQDADVVGLLVRAEYYAEDDEEKEDVKGEAELIIAKQRNGPTDTIPLTFLKEWTRFEDRAWDTTNK